MFFQCIEQRRSKAEVTFHKLRRVLRTIYAREIEDEVCVPAVRIEFCRRTLQIVFIKCNVFADGIVLGLAVTDITQLGKKVLSYEARGSRNQYVHRCMGRLSSEGGAAKNEV